jgi:hypothetical protein
MNEPREAAPAAGFLAHLLERVHPTEPLLQRRQPSLFEPVNPRADVQVRGLADEGADWTSSRPAPASSAVAAVALPLARPEVRSAAMPPVAPVASLSPIDEGPRMATALNIASTQSELRVLRETLRIDTSLRVLHEPARPVPAALRQVPDRPAPADLPPALTVNARPIVIAAPRAVRTLPQPAAPAPAPAAKLGPPAAAATRPVLAPASAARSELAQLSAALRSRPKPPVSTRATQRAQAVQFALRWPAEPAIRELPPVQVTIGCIEVRAVAAPSVPADRKPRSAPQLSLEQYLRERNGERG